MRALGLARERVRVNETLEPLTIQWRLNHSIERGGRLGRLQRWTGIATDDRIGQRGDVIIEKPCR